MIKKIRLIVISILLVLPVSVLAEEKPNVTTLEATPSIGKIDFSGTTEDGSTAVMCKLYNNKDEEIDLLSTEVRENKFVGTFESVNAGTYSVVCANYDGGEFKKTSVVVNKGFNPKTFDGGISLSILLLSICTITSLGTIVYLKKNN